MIHQRYKRTDIQRMVAIGLYIPRFAPMCTVSCGKN